MRKECVYFLKALPNSMAWGGEIYKHFDISSSLENTFLSALQNVKIAEELPSNVDLSLGIQHYLRNFVKDVPFIAWKYDDGSCFVCFKKNQREFLVDLLNSTCQAADFVDIEFAKYDVHDRKLIAVHVAQPPPPPSVSATPVAAPAVQKRRKKEKDEHTEVVVSN